MVWARRGCPGAATNRGLGGWPAVSTVVDPGSLPYERINVSSSNEKGDALGGVGLHFVVPLRRKTGPSEILGIALVAVMRVISASLRKPIEFKGRGVLRVRNDEKDESRTRSLPLLAN
jgi:hypothetical protein